MENSCPVCDYPGVSVGEECPDCGREMEGWEW